MSGLKLSWEAIIVNPRYNEVPRDWQNFFATNRFRYIEVLLHIFYYLWGNQNRSLYWGLSYTEVRYIEVPLYVKHELQLLCDLDSRGRLQLQLTTWYKTALGQDKQGFNPSKWFWLVPVPLSSPVWRLLTKSKWMTNCKGPVYIR